MGKIILCRGKKADTPLTVLQTGVKLYTAEERGKRYRCL